MQNPLRWLLNKIRRKPAAGTPQPIMRCPEPTDFSLRMKRFDEQAKEARQERIAEANRKRNQATLGYGLSSKHFRPRPAHEKRTFDLRAKPEEQDKN